MIHGGGHVMLSRKDIRPKQTQFLLENGRLPVSIDYRLCPEVNIIDGPMTDVCDALQWVQKVLPQMDLKYPGLKITGDRVIVVGWSTGGTLAMSLAWSSSQRGIKPPDAILAFYCPTNYHAECMKPPCASPVKPRFWTDKSMCRLEATQFPRRLRSSRKP